MNGDELRTLEKRIDRLEVKFDERFTSHDNAAMDGRHNQEVLIKELKGQISNIFERLNDLPCKAHEVKVNSSWGLLIILIIGILGLAWRIFSQG